MILPQVLILSTQRSGTHLLQSFLSQHHNVKAHGELFLKFRRNGRLPAMAPDKVNVGILMYNQFPIFLEATKAVNESENCKLIHLLRDPHDVALSCLQMEADKNMLRGEFRAHFVTTDSDDIAQYIKPETRAKPDLLKLPAKKQKTIEQQNIFIEVLKDKEHLEVRYEEMAPCNAEVRAIDPWLQYKLFAFVGLDDIPVDRSTPYRKSGINLRTTR